MTIDRSSAELPLPVGQRSSPLVFDERETALATTVRDHVLLRDACLAPGALIAEKLERLDLDPWPHELGARLGVVERMRVLRRRIGELAEPMPRTRIHLVLLHVLACLPADEVGHDRHGITHMTCEAASAMHIPVADVRRIGRRLSAARATVPVGLVTPSIARNLAAGLRSVAAVTPGTAVAQALMLLSDTVPAGWTPSAAGGSLLEPGPYGTRLGTLVARHDLAAFTEDLATLSVATRLDPETATHVHTVLPELFADLTLASRIATGTEAMSLTVAAELVRNRRRARPREVLRATFTRRTV